MRAVSGPQFVAFSLGLVGVTVAAAAEVTDAALIKRVADGIARQTTRRLVDRSTGVTFTDSAMLAPKPEISI